MKTSQEPENTERVSCQTCLKEIPASEAKSAEAQDYVLYFCGLECYEKWSHQADKKPAD